MTGESKSPETQWGRDVPDQPLYHKPFDNDRLPRGSARPREETMADLKVIELNDELTHVALNGRLDTEGVQEVELQLTSHVAARKKPALVELDQVDFITSLGMGMLVRLARSLHDLKVPMVLVKPQPVVVKMLAASHLDKVLPIEDDLESARKRLET